MITSKLMTDEEILKNSVMSETSNESDDDSEDENEKTETVPTINDAFNAINILNKFYEGNENSDETIFRLIGKIKSDLNNTFIKKKKKKYRVNQQITE